MVENVRDRSRDAARELRRFIEDGVARGALHPGDKLPNERALAEQFRAGRNTIRRIMLSLEDEGWITRHVGRGTFIAAEVRSDEGGGEKPAHDPEKNGDFLLRIVQIASPVDLMELRLGIEPEMAALAAMRAGAIEIDRMQAAVDRSRIAPTLQEFEDCDDELHRTIAESSRNPLFAAMAEIISIVRNAGEWGKLKERTLTSEARHLHLNEHVKLVAAIRERNAAAAREEMHRHLLAVRESMIRG